MKKQKYYYAIVNKENGKPAIISGELPIYWFKSIAIRKLPIAGKRYCVIRVNIDDIEAVILKSKIIQPTK